MTKAARAAVNAQHDIAFADAKGRRDLGGENFRNMLDFEIVVARAERAHFLALAFFGSVRDLIGARSRHATIFLDPDEVSFRAEALRYRPPGAAL
jgi:hypothetical protein